jgi:hypothetical protein
MTGTGLGYTAPTIRAPKRHAVLPMHHPRSASHPWKRGCLMHILIVEDDRTIAGNLHDFLEGRGH